MRTLVLTAAIAVAVLLPSLEARAGACPQCTTNQECVIATGNVDAVCVAWDMDFGCGDQRLSCCPGQGCNLVGPTPSCQIAGACTPVPSDFDAGSVDTGGGAPPAPDAQDGVDGATGPGLDAATSTHADASSVGRLGGGSAQREERCNCEAATAEGAPSGVLALLAAGLVVTVAQRRRR